MAALIFALNNGGDVVGTLATYNAAAAATTAAQEQAGSAGESAAASAALAMEAQIVAQAAATQLASDTAAHELVLAEVAENSAEVAAAQTALDGLLDDMGIVMDNGSVLVPNVSPDEGLSAPFNAWMSLFGQFFDHGLDLVNKGGSGTVYIPCSQMTHCMSRARTATS